MRKDIKIDIATGDVLFPAFPDKDIRPFRWTDNPRGEARYLYGEVDVPDVLTDNVLYNKGFAFAIPYTPVFKEFKLRIRRGHNYVRNAKDGSEWFIVKSAKKNLENICVSQLICISSSSFRGFIENGDIVLYANSNHDFVIDSADKQNTNSMLACVPTNYYLHPLTGVGLIRWLNCSDINDNELAEIIRREFDNDGVTVRNAEYDYNTNQIKLDLE